MKEINGIAGVETYVKHHRVVVYYDLTRITDKGVKSAIFSPLDELINSKVKPTGMVSFVTLGIDRCFDPKDQYYLSELLKKDKGVLALSTRFGEPVQATIFFDPLLTDESRLKAAASKEMLMMGTGDQQTSVETGFVVNESGKISGEIPANEFFTRFVPTTDVEFNNYKSYNDSQMLIYELPFLQALDPEMQQRIPYLVSHASNDDGIVRIKTEFIESGPVIKIWFVEETDDSREY